MKFLTALLIPIAVLAMSAFVMTGSAAAVDIFQNTCDAGGSASNASVCRDVRSQQDSTDDPIIDIIKTAINVISFVVGVAAVIGLIVSSIRLIVANGDSNAVATARTGIIYSLIGVAVVAVAQAIVVFVLNGV